MVLGCVDLASSAHQHVVGLHVEVREEFLISYYDTSNCSSKCIVNYISI